MIRRLRGSALVLGAALVSIVGVLLVGGPELGPVPVCHGETATHVLVAEGTEGDYQEWADAGVAIVANEDQILKGSQGHDVLVALVSTNSGGIVGGDQNSKRPKDGGPTTGDTMCGLATGPGKNIYYGTRFPDTIIDADGDSDIYAGGCKYLGPGTGSTEDDFCDLVRGNGGTDRVWGYAVPAGRVQEIYDGSGQDHNYIGRGKGRVYVVGGSSPSEVPGGGDHVHPCPVNDLVGLGIVHEQIEYVGPSAAFGDDNDPCAYLPKSL